VPPKQQKAAPEQHSSCAGVSQFVAYALGKFISGFAYVLGKFYFGFAYVLGKKLYLCNTNQWYNYYDTQTINRRFDRMGQT
jgi:hypothetical protein